MVEALPWGVFAQIILTAGVFLFITIYGSVLAKQMNRAIAQMGKVEEISNRLDAHDRRFENLAETVSDLNKSFDNSLETFGRVVSLLERTMDRLDELEESGIRSTVRKVFEEEKDDRRELF